MVMVQATALDQMESWDMSHEHIDKSSITMSEVSSHSSETKVNASQYSTSPSSPLSDQYATPLPGHEPIAIVGMGMRLPGQINSAEKLWDLLASGNDAKSSIRPDRYNIDAFHSSNLKSGTVRPNQGYFLDQNLGDFDASFFSMNKAEVERVDPQQRLLLEVVWECLENAGQTRWKGKNIGCYVGSFGEDWSNMSVMDTQNLGMYRVTGNGDFAIANRVSYEYDFKGPSITIKTACSSSLIALHLACQAIQDGSCESAIVAGTNLIITPTISVAMTEQGVLSSSGSCHTFDADADGYGRAEGINAIYIKKLSDALRDGDSIRSIIRGTATNSDGKTSGLSLPNPESHEAVIRHAYKAAGIADFSKTGYFECHGTGTVVGDPLEAQAIDAVFDGSGIIIGSAKANLGHSEGASGLTAVIKAVLALEHCQIPPQIGVNKVNPKIPVATRRLELPQQLTSWPGDRLERASVNSFGITGANAHVVLDSATSIGLTSSTVESVPARPQLLVFSANDPTSLQTTIAQYDHYIAAKKQNLGNVAYNLGTRRTHLLHRAFSITDGKDALSIGSVVKTPSKQSDVVFVFTGQGAQWARMGVELLHDFPSFLNDIRSMDKILQGVLNPPDWKIEAELLRPESTSRLGLAEFAQPVCTAIQIALLNLLQSWGVEPDAVVGHSSGEIAAAVACGAITSSAAIIVAYCRGKATRLDGRPGSMAAVGLAKSEVARHLIEGAVISCENSPESTTISGDTEAVESVIQSIKSENTEAFTRRLKVDQAYHSHHMRTFGMVYEGLISKHVRSQTPSIPFYSSVTGRLAPESHEFNAPYWRYNLESPVLFSSAVQALCDDIKNPFFLEIGPHGALAGPIRQIMKVQDLQAPYTSTLSRNKNSTESLLSAVGQLWQNGAEIDFSTQYPQGTVLTDLPIYPWNHSVNYWSESRLAKEWRLRRFPHHDLLGSRVLEMSDLEPAWRNMLDLQDVPWLKDHRVHNDIIMPCAAYITMAGEAVRQLKGVMDFTCRRISVKSAMLLYEERKQELLTTFHPLRLTETLDSDWYEFSVSSYDGHVWAKRCTGEVKAGGNSLVALGIEPLQRAVNSGAWYKAMQKVGLNYGPAFTGLYSISSSPIEQLATATIQDCTFPAGSTYQIHPTTIDFVLQLFSTAASKGLARNLQQLCLPTSIDEIYVRHGKGDLRTSVRAKYSPGGPIIGDALVASEGTTALSIKGLRMSPADNGSVSVPQGTHGATEIIWKRDIDFQDPRDLIGSSKSRKDSHKLVEKLALLCILESDYRLRHCEAAQPHLQKYQNWLKQQKERALNGEYQIVEDAQLLSALSASERLSCLQHVAKEVESSPGAPGGQALLVVLKALPEIFNGNVEPLETLVKDDLLANLYSYSDLWHCSEYIKLLAHGNPNLRVLEIGAGTGGTTAHVLPDLYSANGQPMYSQYTYTDISKGFLHSAKDRFKDHRGMDFAVLDITKDTREQGFEYEQYDLVLAANVIHVTSEISVSLQNVQKLLRPQGRLLLQELCPLSRWINYIMGILPDWWLGGPDGRVEEPYISPDRWNVELKKAGFVNGADSIIHDDEVPFQMNANIIASTPSLSNETEDPRRVTLLVNTPVSTDSRDIAVHLIKRGYHVDFCTIKDKSPPNQDLISILDLGTASLRNMGSDFFRDMQALFKGCSPTDTILWLTKSAQTECLSPDHAMILGMARTLRSELNLHFTTLEIDQIDSKLPGVVFDVFDKARNRLATDTTNPDYEFSYFDGAVHVPRMNWTSLNEQLTTTSSHSNDSILTIETPGLPQTLAWQMTSREPLKPGQVRIETRAVGLNFKDVLVSMGIVEVPGNHMGLELSGIVTEIGQGVDDLSVGDRVAALTQQGFSSRFAIARELCVRLPDSLSFSDAATMPCVYSTALYSLVDVARLEKNQTVLIHSAGGGVGIAAIQVCQMIGATIFATVGSEEKTQFLVETFGIARHRIFNSRDTSFLTDVLRETGGRGVDVVLNSLSGELLHASWECVAAFGTMVEIGKRDLIGRGQVGLDKFEANRSYCGVDLAALCVHKPTICYKLLKTTMQLFESGKIQPIQPTKIFAATDIREAFHYMQKGQHIGKIVVDMPENPEDLAAKQSRPSLQLRSNACYVLVGGLGGLGKAVATYLVESGATNLMFISRSAGRSVAHEEFFNELRAMGCEPQAYASSAVDSEAVQKAIKQCVKPVAGVLQMTMLLKDRNFFDMTFEDWQAAVGPKVQATWNLHNALSNTELDFFLLFSSISGMCGQWGQANYAAANTFLDAFVQYRHSLKLPAAVINVGVMGDVGYFSENPADLAQFHKWGYKSLTERELLDAVHLAIKRQSSVSDRQDGFINSSQIPIGMLSNMPLDDPANCIVWKRDSRMAGYRNFENKASEFSDIGSQGLKHFISRVANDTRILSQDSSIDYVTMEIGKQIYSFMLRSEDEVDTKQSLLSMGVDSLVSIEIRNWWAQTFGFSVSVLEILNCGSLDQLGQLAVDGLVAKYGQA